jgi:type IV pilus assembly protein PilY1
MKLKPLFQQRLRALLAGFVLAITAGAPAVHAAPGTLAQSPLFTTNAVPPNIFFLNDDSGSMAWETLTPDLTHQGRFASAQPDGGTQFNDQVIQRSGCSFNYGSIFEDSGINTCEVAAEEEWRIRTSRFNPLYYNPERVYEPWVGNDKNEKPFEDMKIANALINPYDPDKGNVNLSTQSADKGRSYYSSQTWKDWCSAKGYSSGDCKGWRYYKWNDKNNNRLYENGEEEVQWVQDLTDEQKTNFANWFSYHRSRNHEAKYALSKAISEASNARLGYGVLNNSNQRIRIGDSTKIQSDAVLKKLFETGSANTTPLRKQLKQVGEYYRTGSFFGSNGDSPILGKDDGGACQLNTTILMTDGFYNDNSPDVGNVDGDNGAPYADGYSNTLADVAMYYYENDLSGLTNNVPPTQADPATHQHMNTYGVAFGLTGTHDPKTTDILNPGFSWPDPSQSDSAKIDDLWHAAVNSRGQFFSAQKPDELVTTLTSTVRNITGRHDSASRVAVSSGRFDANGKLFFSQFTPGAWSGDLQALTPDGKDIWKASDELKSNAFGSRKIITYNGQQGIPFEWQSLSTGQQQYIGSELILKYLRGDRSQEGKGLRTRDGVLGDIINSGPIFVGAPGLIYSNSDPFGNADNRYSKFWSDNKGRTPMVYVGANDGMLHGFNANTGEELLAYIPLSVTANLKSLSDPNYAHHYFVDQTPAVSDTFFASATENSASWHTVLAGGLGAGGRGIYALDITHPNNFSEANASSTVLWEFTDADDTQNKIGGDKGMPSDVGYTLARPVIALTNATRNGLKRWAAIVGNGYNADSGVAKLFVLFLDADPSDGWNNGSDYIEISTNVGTVNDKNGLSSPSAVDSNGDGIVDLAYAGDLQGNLWAFDLSDTDISKWGTAYGDTAKPKPLFTAINHSGKPQPITAKPAVARLASIPTTDKNTPNLMVYFGTGQYLNQNDIGNHQTQTFYAVRDSGDGDLKRSSLQAQEIITGKTNSGVEARLTKDLYVNYDDPENPSFGWYIDLNSAAADTGERVVANAVVRRDIVYFTTFIPNTDKCGQGGSSWFMFVRANNGAPPPTELVDISRDKLLGQDDRLNDIPASGVQALNDGIQAGLGGPTFAADEAILSKDDRVKLNPKVTQKGRRLSWRELRRK